MLRTHYRQPIDWTVKELEEAEASLIAGTTQSGNCRAGEQIAKAVLEALIGRPEYAMQRSLLNYRTGKVARSCELPCDR